MENKLREKLEADKKELQDVNFSLQELNKSKQWLTAKGLELNGSIKTLESLLAPEKADVLKEKEIPDLNALEDEKKL